MTEQLAHRDLRNRSAEILREVAAGASYEITNHGEVVALLTPPAPDGRLRVRSATSRHPFSQIRRVRRSESTQSALDDLRGDR
jgi:prevent-host-death family protein